jgi:hypothetical protein
VGMRVPQASFMPVLTIGDYSDVLIVTRRVRSASISDLVPVSVTPGTVETIQGLLVKQVPYCVTRSGGSRRNRYPQYRLRGIHGQFEIGRILLILLVGAGRFERPTPCAQGRCATRLRYAPT